MNDILVATIKKNAMEDIQIAWREFKGRRFLDIRVYADFDGNGEKRPTKNTKSAWTGKDGVERSGFSVLVDSIASTRTVGPGKRGARGVPFDDELRF